MLIDAGFLSPKICPWYQSHEAAAFDSPEAVALEEDHKVGSPVIAAPDEDRWVVLKMSSDK